MKNILFYCNTHYQIIMALQITKCFYSKDNVNYIISDHSNNAKLYSENLKKIIGENKVIFLQTKKFDYTKSNISKILFKIRQLIFHNFPFAKLPLKSFDEFITYNNTPSITLLVNHLIRLNPDIKISRMEEGILSYNNTIQNKDNNNGIISKIKNLIKDKLGYNILYKNEQSLYCAFPSLYIGKLKTIQIPQIDTNDSEFNNIISKTFGVDKLKLSYPQKYIFFSSIFDFEGGEPVGELELANRIAELVGKDNLLVKVHPRDSVKRFTREGLIVDENSSVPWEAIQLNYDFSKHVFITVCSTSVLNINSIILNPPMTIFAYKLVKNKNNTILKTSIKAFEQLRTFLVNTSSFKFIKNIENLSDICL